MIIVLNVLAFLWQLTQEPNLKEAFFLYGMVPARYSDPSLASHFTAFEQIFPFVTSMFLHGGFLHILGNMWFLHIFGDNIEDRLGHIRYFIFYFLSGVAAGLVHLFMSWHSKIPTIGASGAIAGVMGAYLILHPRAKILTLVPIFFFFQLFEIPAFVFLGYWFLLQVLFASFSGGEGGGIAWTAHAGGFVAGIVVFKLLDLIPRTGISDGIRQRTERRTTPRLQTISPGYSEETLDLSGTIRLTPREARSGARKVISVPQGFRRKNLIVTVPPGMKEGQRLRLKGLGKKDAEGNRGDLFLEVRMMD
jgi:membrane associated rhomboid family serine protease